MSVFDSTGKVNLKPIGHSVIAPDAEVRPMAASSTYDIFPVVPYEPLTPPEDWQAARQWIDDELQRLAAALRNQIIDTASWILYGVADPINPLDPTEKPIVNYPFSGFFNGGQPSQVDRANGTITIPNQGLYQIFGLVTGNHSVSQNNETIALSIDVDGVDAAIDVRDAATPQTQSRAFSGGVVRGFNGGEVIRLEMEATANFGTFTIVSSSFEVRRVGDMP